MGVDQTGEGERLLLRRRRNQLNRAADDAVEPADQKRTLRHQHDAAPIALEILRRRRAQPTEPGAVEDRFRRRIAKLAERALAQLGNFLDRHLNRHATPPVTAAS